MLQSRFTVRTEIPRTSPVSSSLRSPKGTTPGLHAFDHGELVRGLFAHKRTPRARIIGAQFARNRPRWSPNRFRAAQLPAELAGHDEKHLAISARHVVKKSQQFL